MSNTCSPSIPTRPTLDANLLYLIDNSNTELAGYNLTSKTFTIPILKNFGDTLGFSQNQSHHGLNILSRNNAADTKKKLVPQKNSPCFNLKDQVTLMVQPLNTVNRAKNISAQPVTSKLIVKTKLAITSAPIIKPDPSTTTTENFWEISSLSSLAAHTLFPALAVGVLVTFPPAGTLLFSTAFMVGLAVVAGEIAAQFFDTVFLGRGKNLDPYAIATAFIIGTVAYPLQILLPLQSATSLVQHLARPLMDAALTTGAYTLYTTLSPNAQLDYSSPEFYKTLALSVVIGSRVRSLFAAKQAALKTELQVPNPYRKNAIIE